MKKNIFIICFLISSLLVAFALKTTAQFVGKVWPPPAKQGSTQDTAIKFLTADGKIRMDSAFLIADETTIEFVGRFAIIHCYNDSLAKLIHQKWNQLINGTHYEKSTGTLGESIHYTFYLTKGDAIYIRNWAKINL